MISAVVLAKNEEEIIERCLKSISWCDEIVVVDDNSKDNTERIARRYGARVYKRSLNKDYSEQRNFGLSHAKGEWVIFLDADEIVSQKLAEEIKDKIADTNFNGFLIKREYFFLGRKITHGEVGQTWLLRLAKREKGGWRRAVHEEWNVKGSVGRLQNPILHYPNKTISGFLSDINRYSEIHAFENIKEKKHFNFLFVIFYPFGKFFLNYFLKLGFLDGSAGFVIAVMMSFHSFLSWSRVWLISQKQKEYI